MSTQQKQSEIPVLRLKDGSLPIERRGSDDLLIYTRFVRHLHGERAAFDRALALRFGG